MKAQDIIRSVLDLLDQAEQQPEIKVQYNDEPESEVETSRFKQIFAMLSNPADSPLANSPNEVPIADRMTASARIMVRICLRVEPTARNIPISRVRSITPMASVLIMAINEGIDRKTTIAYMPLKIELNKPIFCSRYSRPATSLNCG